MEGVMTYRRATTFIPVLLALTALVATGTTARAQSFFTYVSSSGSDFDDCVTPATACRTLSGAQNKTAEFGSISCVNPANYSSLTITKSITIDCLAGGGGLNSAGLLINAPGKTVWPGPS